MRIEHDDFPIYVESSEDGFFSARVAAHAGGGAPHLMPWPSLGTLTEDLLTPIFLNIRQSHDSSASRAFLMGLSEQLFSALFADGVLESYLVSHQRVRALDRRRALRIRIVIDPETTGGDVFSALPWELVYFQRQRRFLTRSIWTPIVRQMLLRFPSDPDPDPVERPLRMVVAASDPDDFPALNLALEVRAIRKELRSTPGIRLVVLERADLRSLDRCLTREQPHVLHFMGHCTVGDEDEAHIQLSSSSGSSQAVSGSELAALLENCADLRLVVLNACHTSRYPSRVGRDPLSGIAQALSVSGIPAVVAMQASVSDRAALLFSRACYSGLGAGMPLETSVTLGRQAIFRDSPDSFEWAIPVLYLSVRSGDLFPVRDLLQMIVGQGIDAARAEFLIHYSSQLGCGKRICEQLVCGLNHRPPTERYWRYILLGKLACSSSEAFIRRGLSDPNLLARKGAGEALLMMNMQ